MLNKLIVQSRLKICIFVLLILSLTAAYAQHPDYQVYSNTRFGYIVEYPSNLLIAQGEADNGDGQVFRSKDGRCEMLVYAGYNALNETLKEVYRKEIAKHSKVTYRLLKPKFFVVSGIDADRVFYHKIIYRSGIFYTLQITYPVSEKALYDRVTAKVSESFTNR